MDVSISDVVNSSMLVESAKTLRPMLSDTPMRIPTSREEIVSTKVTRVKFDVTLPVESNQEYIYNQIGLAIKDKIELAMLSTTKESLSLPLDNRGFHIYASKRCIQEMLDSYWNVVRGKSKKWVFRFTPRTEMGLLAKSVYPRAYGTCDGIPVYDCSCGGMFIADSKDTYMSPPYMTMTENQDKESYNIDLAFHHHVGSLSKLSY